MKSLRHNRIIELVKTRDISTQEELANILIEEGIDVTQATVSRDIRELKLSKGISASGKQKYFYDANDNSKLSEKYVRVINECYVSMDLAMNILVVKTVPGMAMAVAAAIDGMHFSEVVGTIAGDDTIMCAIRTVEDAQKIMEKLKKIVKH